MIGWQRSQSGTSVAPRMIVMSHRTDASSVLAETVRAACLDAARLAYEDAGIRGLCADGRWDAALAAIRQLDLSTLAARPPRADDAPAR